MSSRYRILFPKIGDKRTEQVSHWIFSMNGQDYVGYHKDGRSQRGFSLSKEFPPQWEYVNDKLSKNNYA